MRIRKSTLSTGAEKKRFLSFDMSNLLILGAGQYGNVAKEIAESTGLYEHISFLDDRSSIAIGMIDEYDKYISEYENAVVAVGNPDIRLKFIGKLIDAGYIVPALIHPKAYVSPTAIIGKGCFIEPMTIVHTEAAIGMGCIISAGAIVNHNSVIGDGCHIDCGAIVGARVRITDNTKVEYGQIVRE